MITVIYSQIQVVNPNSHNNKKDKALNYLYFFVIAVKLSNVVIAFTCVFHLIQLDYADKFLGYAINLEHFQRVDLGGIRLDVARLNYADVERVFSIEQLVTVVFFEWLRVDSALEVKIGQRFGEHIGTLIKNDHNLARLEQVVHLNFGADHCVRRALTFNTKRAFKFNRNKK